jgi:hypothetical protein
MIEENQDVGSLEPPEFDFVATFARDVEAMFSNWIELGYRNTATAIKVVQS